MILVDSSIWVDHLRVGDLHLVDLLMGARVLGHPHVLGEIALGSLRDRRTVLRLLRDLPRAAVAHDDEVLDLIERRQLFGRGVGYTDAHLIVSAQLSVARIWTRDKRLLALAAALGLAHTPPAR